MYKDTCGPQTLANRHETKDKTTTKPPQPKTTRKSPSQICVSPQIKTANKERGRAQQNKKHIQICLRYSDLSHRITLKNMQTNYPLRQCAKYSTSLPRMSHLRTDKRIQCCRQTGWFSGYSSPSSSTIRSALWENAHPSLAAVPVTC